MRSVSQPNLLERATAVGLSLVAIGAGFLPAIGAEPLTSIFAGVTIGAGAGAMVMTVFGDVADDRLLLQQSRGVALGSIMLSALALTVADSRSTIETLMSDGLANDSSAQAAEFTY